MRFLILYVLSFLSAFLMFQLELMTAKILLPTYGGSHMVWGSCMVFFQAMLLLGYIATQRISEHLPFSKIRWILMGLMLLPWLFFPGHFLTIASHDTRIPLALDVFFKLTITIGPVFFVLSTMSIVLQVWMLSAITPTAQKINPYRLYSISNIGSFAGLVSYPFIFEHMFELQQQQAIWQVLYGVLLVTFFSGLMLIPVSKQKIQEDIGNADTSPPVSEIRKFEWFILGAAGVAAFMAVNNLITSEIASVPLLWILPLGIYLLSFVLNFKQKPWCPAFINRNILAILIISFLCFVLVLKRFLPTMISVGVLGILQFFICMYCQNRLISTKPENKKDLPKFYVLFSLGGFFSGLLITWIVPFISDIWIEFPIALMLTATVAGHNIKKETFHIRNFFLPVSFFIFLIVWSLMFPRYNITGLVILMIGSFLVFLDIRKFPAKMFNLILLFFILFSAIDMSINDTIFQKRNFYGQYKIMQEGPMRTLSCGRILHGLQFAGGPFEMEPTIYYSRKTAVGEIMESDDFDIHSIGAIGLGAGVISALTKKGQTLDFYEIDPLVKEMAETYFTFLKNSRAEISYHMGDARISMEQLTDKKYDILIIDAFSGDAIPFHLINADVIKLYRQRLESDGMILFHISNNFLDLQPVLYKIAQKENARAFLRINNSVDRFTFPSIWMVFTWDESVYQKIKNKGWSEAVLKPKYENMRLWTDHYSSILPIINYEVIRNDIVGYIPSFLKKNKKP